VNRTDRLYALVEELRAASPRRRSARWLAGRFEVSVRTVERDLSALQQAGVPIWADTGRAGGYTLDPAATLGPMSFTPDEALAVVVGLGALGRGPFRQSAGSALRKLLAVMPAGDAGRATAVAGRVRLLEPEAGAPVPAAFGVALRGDRVVRLVYRARDGAETLREVEPLGSIGKGGDWYLVAWCRLRGGVRAFRGDRMVSVELTDEHPQPRELRWEDLDIPFGTLRPVVDDAS
jgi:predicted DNA-binding transcriptional regulator YafY